jgi:hypothetical protein
MVKARRSGPVRGYLSRADGNLAINLFHDYGGGSGAIAALRGQGETTIPQLYLTHPHLQPGKAVLGLPLRQFQVQPLSRGILLQVGIYLIEGNLQSQVPT